MLGVFELGRSLAGLGVNHYKQLDAVYGAKWRTLAEEWRKLFAEAAQCENLSNEVMEYLTDAGQRWTLFLDIMREVGNYAVEQMEGGEGLVLVYDYNVVIDGRDLERPVNYLLVQIRPPEGISRSRIAAVYDY